MPQLSGNQADATLNQDVIVRRGQCIAHQPPADNTPATSPVTGG